MSTVESLTYEPAKAPSPPSERGAWLAACSIALAGLAVLVAVLSGAIGRSSTQPPPLPVRATTPSSLGASAPAAPLSPLGAGADLATDAAPAAGADPSIAGAIVALPSGTQQSGDSRRFRQGTRVHIAKRWMEGFYPIYSTAQQVFGVDWLLIASIHMQESAFSTAPGIYRGLNFAHCCGGPMQFNVTNGGGRGPPTTWDLVSNSFVYGRRPAAYNHRTAAHPSIYDDYDAIMAAAHLLSADGAGYQLEASAWNAAYDYYGHDATGVLYADQVLARAIGWSQHGFCVNCGVEQRLVDAVDGAYGAPARGTLAAPAPKAPPRKRGKAAR
jgi:hypothetical protein